MTKSESSQPDKPSAEQIEAFRQENFIHAHVGEIPDAGLEAWAVESNMVLKFLCDAGIERLSTPSAGVSIKEPWLPVRRASLEWLARQDMNAVDRAYVAMEAIAMAQLALAEHPEGFAQSATKRIVAMPLLKRIREQRDDCAHALRRLVDVVERNFPMPAGVHPGSPLDHARAALAAVPTYEQQLRNIAEGIGMDYEELIGATKNLPDRKAP